MGTTCLHLHSPCGICFLVLYGMLGQEGDPNYKRERKRRPKTQS